MQFLDENGVKVLWAAVKKADQALDAKIRGKINLTRETKLTLANKCAVLSNNSVVFYLITDSTGKLYSTSETRININPDITSLVSAEGANVGDIFIIGKLSSLPVYRIIPLNDAKAETTYFKGTNGVMTPWDKTRVNKVNAIEATANNAANNLPTYGESNMNNALNTGVYPWCTLGRPAGATGAFTCITKKSTTKDGNGYWTIEQTAYGREAELGQVYKRVIFKQDNKDAEYTDWINVTRINEGYDGRLIIKNESGSGIYMTNDELQLCIKDRHNLSLRSVVVEPDNAVDILSIHIDNHVSVDELIIRHNDSRYKFDFNKAIELGIITQV